jgi:hypothetical protein
MDYLWELVIDAEVPRIFPGCAKDISFVRVVTVYSRRNKAKRRVKT